MTAIRTVLVVATFVFCACGVDSGAAMDPHPVEPIVTRVPPTGSPAPRQPSESLRSTPSVAASLTEFQPLTGCPSITEDGLDKVVAVAIDGLADTTSEDGWSRACARVRRSGGSEPAYIVTLKIGWMGSLHEYAAILDAEEIEGLADEAYLFDAGHQIALRSGELVAVVGYSGDTTSSVGTWAQRVAEHLSG